MVDHRQLAAARSVPPLGAGHAPFGTLCTARSHATSTRSSSERGVTVGPRTRDRNRPTPGRAGPSVRSARSQRRRASRQPARLALQPHDYAHTLLHAVSPSTNPTRERASRSGFAVFAVPAAALAACDGLERRAGSAVAHASASWSHPRRIRSAIDGSRAHDGSGCGQPVCRQMSAACTWRSHVSRSSARHVSRAHSRERSRFSRGYARTTCAWDEAGLIPTPSRSSLKPPSRRPEAHEAKPAALLRLTANARSLIGRWWSKT